MPAEKNNSDEKKQPTSGSSRPNQMLKNADLIFVSDVHLHDEKDKRAQLLISLIRDCRKTNVRKFVLGGDVFEFYWARGSYFKEKFAFLFNELQLLAKSGTEVFFIQGNHEYCMEETSVDGVTILEADGTSLRLDMEDGSSLRIGISHGDLINAPKKYLIFKSILNSGVFKFIFGLIPSRMADRFALSYAHQSRKTDKYRKLRHTSILNSAFKRAKREQEDVHIFGHFHYPYQCKNGETEVLCVPSWDLPNALLLKNREFFRLNIKDSNISCQPVNYKEFSEFAKI